MLSDKGGDSMITKYLEELKLYGALNFYNEETNKELDAGTLLEGMLKSELSRRSINALNRRIKQANFPVVREWEGIDYSKNKEIDFKKIRIISNEETIKNRTNICLIGAPGLGKTHCLISMGRDLCRKGLNVSFYTACDLVNQLSEAKNKYQLTKFMDKLLRPDLLILDELGFVPFCDNGARLLFDVFSKRYERGSIAISSNLSFEKWGEIFGSIELTTALIDRFIHRCEIFTFRGDSHRLLSSIDKKNDKVHPDFKGEGAHRQS